MLHISVYGDDRIYLEEIEDIMSDFCDERNIEYQVESVSANDHVIEFQKMRINLSKGQIYFKEGNQRISLEQIAIIESRSHSLEFTIYEHSVEKKYTMPGKLADIQILLSGSGFIRIHQSYLVNLRYIRNMSYNQAILWNGVVVPVSRSRHQEAKKKLLLYREEVQGGA